MIGNSPAVLDFNRLFLELNQFNCKYLLVLADQCQGVHGCVIDDEENILGSHDSILHRWT